MAETVLLQRFPAFQLRTRAVAVVGQLRALRVQVAQAGVVPVRVVLLLLRALRIQAVVVEVAVTVRTVPLVAPVLLS
jgi:hypothetical protein